MKIGDLVQFDHPKKLLYGIVMNFETAENTIERGYTAFNIESARIWLIGGAFESKKTILVDCNDPRLRAVLREEEE